MEIFIVWLALAILCGVYASKLNRSGFGYFLLACVLSPLIGFIALLIFGNNDVKAEESNKNIMIFPKDAYEKVLNELLLFYKDHNLESSEGNESRENEKLYINNKQEFFIIKIGDNDITVETFNLPKFNDIQPEIKENKSNIDDLVKLGELLEKGLLTKEEFEAQKAKLLNA